MAPPSRALLEWERLYDTLRPHHSLDGRTPYRVSLSSAIQPGLVVAAHMY